MFLQPLANLNMTLYHWTLNRTKLKAKGFVSRQGGHSEGKLGIWFTDQLVGEPEGLPPTIKMVTVDIPEDDIIKYEEINQGSGYRAFRIPASVANQYELKYPTLYIDRGVFKLTVF